MALAISGPGNLAAAPPLSGRGESPHHRLYEFAKTALIKIFVSPYASVCDLYCGGGADTDKWDEAQIGHYIGMDVSMSGINEAREICESQTKPYTAEFCQLDPCSGDLETHMKDKGVPVDIVCCLQHLQLCFDSEERARSLLCNVFSMLKPGGYFFGITHDSSTIWTKYQKNVEALHNKGSGMKPNFANCIRSENYSIAFELEEEKFQLFGKKYQLKFASDITSETHCLVHFSSLIRLARDAGLDYVEIQNLTEFYDDNRAIFAGMLHGYGPNFVDPRGRLLSRSFDVLGLYALFVFQKPDLEAASLLFSPTLHIGNCAHDENEEKHTYVETAASLNMDNAKGILGPGPADLRFSAPL